MNNLLVITGTQRSGTSFMAEFFRRCGFDLGTVFWDDRVNGGLESPDICNFYKSIVGDPDFPFHGYWDMIERDKFYSFEKLQNQFKVVKFSYLLSNPLFMQTWLDRRKGSPDKLLIMKRPLEDVVRSRRTKPEFDKEDSKHLPRTLEEMQQNWFDSLSIINHNKVPHFFIRFPDPDAYQVIAKLEANIPFLLPDNAVEIYNNLFDINKIQFR